MLAEPPALIRLDASEASRGERSAHALVVSLAACVQDAKLMFRGCSLAESKLVKKSGKLGLETLGLCSSVRQRVNVQSRR